MSVLSNETIADNLKSLNGWVYKNDILTKTYHFEQYLAGVAFAGAVGTLAEAHNHHPDLLIGWRKVTVSFTTHDAGSKVTQKDIDAAAAIESLGYPK